MSKNLTLDHQLCFAIYAASNSVIRAYQKELKKYDITYPQYLVLLVLLEIEVAPVKFIANRLKIDSGSLSPILKRMEKANLIIKSRNKKDERLVYVHLTSKAISLKSLIVNIQKTVTCQTGLNNEEYAYLRDSVKDLLTNLEADEDRGYIHKSVA